MTKTWREPPGAGGGLGWPGSSVWGAGLGTRVCGLAQMEEPSGLFTLMSLFFFFGGVGGRGVVRSPQVQPGEWGTQSLGKGAGRACGNNPLGVHARIPDPRAQVQPQPEAAQQWGWPPRGGRGSLPSTAVVPLDRMLLQSVGDRTGLLIVRDCSRVESTRLISVSACHTAGVEQVDFRAFRGPSAVGGTILAK